MASQIIFFYKNRADYSYTNVVASASEGNTYAPYVLNRSNLSAWLTTGSVDANNTTLTIDFSEKRTVSDIILIKHNFKSFNIKHWDDVSSSYQDFSPPINETTNTAETSYYVVTTLETSKIQITILGTQVANEDKFLYQFIATQRIGQLYGWPQIVSPTLSRNRITNQMLSGKLNVVENIGAFMCQLTVDSWSNDGDLSIVENLYDSNEGFLVWLCGGDETQFKTVRQGYRLEDLFLMKCTDEYTPEYNDGVYNNGIKIQMTLQEVID